MNCSIFEALMLVCFGASWPFALWKTYRTKRTEGKSARFLVLILLGYIFGAIHKILYNCDWVLLLYTANALLVLTDLVLVILYRSGGRMSGRPMSRYTD